VHRVEGLTAVLVGDADQVDDDVAAGDAAAPQ
jgi:hypothetical protein